MNIRTTPEGLPLPDRFEEQALDFTLNHPESSEHTPYSLGELIMRFCPDIEHIMKHDRELAWEEFDHVNEEEAIEFTSAMDSGYLFFIGIATYLQFLRSGVDDIDEFINSTSAKLPASNKQERYRVYRVISGSEFVEMNESREPNDDFDSSMIAYSDASELFFMSPFLETLIQKEVQNTTRYLSNNLYELYEDGFMRGVENSIEMYIQCYEERTLNRAFS